MSKALYSKLLLAVPILLIGAGTAYATPSTLTTNAAPAVTVTYTLPSTPGAQASFSFTPTIASTFMYVTGVTNAPWLTYSTSASNVAAGTAATFTFQANAVAGTMSPGTYTGTVAYATTTAGYIGAAGTATVTVTLSIKGPNATFGCTETPTINGSAGGNVGNMSWTTGTITIAVTCTSSGEEISFLVTPGGNLGTGALPMTVSPTGGIAYLWGSAPITVTIPEQLLLSTPPGNSLTGTLTIQPTNGSVPLVVNLNVNVAAAALSVTSVTPTELPVDTVNSHTVVVTGTGFAQGGVTTAEVAIASGSMSGTGVSVLVVSSTEMIVTIPASDLGVLQTDHLEIYNNSVGATGGNIKTIYVTTKPIIYSVTNAASFQETNTAGNVPAVAPYEIISIFGANFAGPTEMLTATLSNALMLQFPSSITEANAPSGAGAVAVEFYTTGEATGVSIANAPLIFVSANQINAIVPQEVVASLGSSSGNPGLTLGVHVIVSVNSILSNTNITYFPLDVATAAPGVFTPSGSGRGEAAVINAAFVTGTVTTPATLNTATTPATHGNVVTIYATGLGEFSGGYGTNTDAAIETTSTAPGACITPAAYDGILGGGGTPPSAAYGTTSESDIATQTPPTSPSLDGLVFQSLYMWSGTLPPCLQAGATTGLFQVLVDSVAVSPTYVGLVADSVVGLYQIIVTLPATWVIPPVNGTVPVQIIQNSSTPGSPTSASQVGATIYVN